MILRKRTAKAGRRQVRKAGKGGERKPKRPAKGVVRVRSTRRPQSDTIASARRFIAAARLPQVHRRRAAAAPSNTIDTAFDSVKNQAAIVGSEVVSFVRGVTAERREAIVHSSLLAQLVAKKSVADASRVDAWFNAYFDVLKNIGWVVQDTSFAEYRESSENLEAHEAILAVATSLLGAAAPAALALVKTTLDALRSMNPESPWITIFSRESQTGRTAHFQISLAEQDDAGQFFVNLMAFGIEAKSTITRVLFFKLRSNEATLRHHSGRVTINTAVLEEVRDDIKAKLARHASDYIKALPDLD